MNTVAMVAVEVLYLGVAFVVGWLCSDAVRSVTTPALVDDETATPGE